MNELIEVEYVTEITIICSFWVYMSWATKQFCWFLELNIRSRISKNKHIFGNPPREIESYINYYSSLKFIFYVFEEKTFCSSRHVPLRLRGVVRAFNKDFWFSIFMTWKLWNINIMSQKVILWFKIWQKNDTRDDCTTDQWWSVSIYDMEGYDRPTQLISYTVGSV